MSNTLQDLGVLVKDIRKAKQALRDAEKNQAMFVIANADELVGRGLVSIKVKEGALYRQMEFEMGREQTLRVMG